MSRRFFYAQGQSAASRGVTLDQSAFWPHRNIMSWSSWLAFTSGFIHQAGRLKAKSRNTDTLKHLKE